MGQTTTGEHATKTQGKSNCPVKIRMKQPGAIEKFLKRREAQTAVGKEVETHTKKRTSTQ